MKLRPRASCPSNKGGGVVQSRGLNYPSPSHRPEADRSYLNHCRISSLPSFCLLACTEQWIRHPLDQTSSLPRASRCALALGSKSFSTELVRASGQTCSTPGSPLHMYHYVTRQLSSWILCVSGLSDIVLLDLGTPLKGRRGGDALSRVENHVGLFSLSVRN